MLDVGTRAELAERTGQRWLEDIFKELVRRAGAGAPALA